MVLIVASISGYPWSEFAQNLTLLKVTLLKYMVIAIQRTRRDLTMRQSAISRVRLIKVRSKAFELFELEGCLR